MLSIESDFSILVKTGTGNERVKKMEKNSEISEDEMRKGIDKIQQITDEFIEKIDKIVKLKEQEIMEV